MPAEYDFRISSETLPETQLYNVYQLLYMGLGFLGSFPAERVGSAVLPFCRKIAQKAKSHI